MDNRMGHAFTALWLTFCAIWLLSALRLKAVKSQESVGSRMLYQAPLLAAWILLFTRYSRWGALGRRFVPESQTVAIIGLVLTAAGMAFACWARYALGQNWSSKVTIKVDHELIRRGPYAYVRHPIYTGLLLAIAGTALASGEWRALAALLLAWISFYQKARTEEKMLAQEFGAAFAEHRRHTGFFLPRLVPSSR
ncbi:MAG TPA: isoprenylcysteine carboxylmethyltransferase family protein [Terriglobales bacterium]|nr:isoprenylcysteine carboxylmethyltransferase family protein [Terriglobales bacterium]